LDEHGGPFWHCAIAQDSQILDIIQKNGRALTNISVDSGTVLSDSNTRIAADRQQVIGN
jgi:hypothetical protein